MRDVPSCTKCHQPIIDVKIVCRYCGHELTTEDDDNGWGLLPVLAVVVVIGCAVFGVGLLIGTFLVGR